MLILSQLTGRPWRMFLVKVSYLKVNWGHPRHTGSCDTTYHPPCRSCSICGGSWISGPEIPLSESDDTCQCHYRNLTRSPLDHGHTRSETCMWDVTLFSPTPGVRVSSPFCVTCIMHHASCITSCSVWFRRPLRTSSLRWSLFRKDSTIEAKRQRQESEEEEVW